MTVQRHNATSALKQRSEFSVAGRLLDTKLSNVASAPVRRLNVTSTFEKVPAGVKSPSANTSRTSMARTPLGL